MLVTMDQKIVFRERSIHMGDLKQLKTTKKIEKITQKLILGLIFCRFWCLAELVNGSKKHE